MADDPAFEDSAFEDPVFEDAARQLARDLRATGHAVLASFLLEVVPATGAVPNGQLRQLAAERLRQVAEVDDVAPLLRSTAAGLADTAADMTRLRGRTGTVWITWDDAALGPGEPAPRDAGYLVSWQSERGEPDWWEEGPAFTELADALAWARQRTDSVVVRPVWDQGTHYWAGSGPDRRNLPPLDEPGA